MATNGHGVADLDSLEEDEGVEIPDDLLKDQFCDPDNPVTINFREISAAAYKIQGGIQYTPCSVSVENKSSLCGDALYMWDMIIEC